MPATSPAQSSSAPPSHDVEAERVQVGGKYLLAPEIQRGIRRLTPLLRMLNGLKRIRTAQTGSRSLVDEIFERSWRGLHLGRDATACADRAAGSMLAGTRLSGLEGSCLVDLGINPEAATAVAEHAIRDAGTMIDPELLEAFLERAADLLDPCDTQLARKPGRPDVPDFVEMLIRQPRAGATHPVGGRKILEPTETHGDHCAMVAVYAVLLSPLFGADRGTVFLTGLAHHLFNAAVPDIGFAGDRVLAALELDRAVTRNAFDQALAQLDKPLEAQAREALSHTRRTDTPEAWCFHAADVLDRTIEMAWHAESSSFTLREAMHDFNIVHEAPEQQLQRRVLEAADIWHDWSGSATGEAFGAD